MGVYIKRIILELIGSTIVLAFFWVILALLNINGLFIGVAFAIIIRNVLHAIWFVYKNKSNSELQRSGAEPPQGFEYVDKDNPGFEINEDLKLSASGTKKTKND